MWKKNLLQEMVVVVVGGGGEGLVPPCPPFSTALKVNCFVHCSSLDKVYTEIHHRTVLLLKCKYYCIHATRMQCYWDIYVNSFCPQTARLWNSLPIECFPLTYDLRGFTPRINRHRLTVGSS